MPETLYELLGVVPDAGLSELRASYKRRMLAVHPDKGGTVERCQRVVAAFELLANPAARQLYDARLAKTATAKRRSSPHVARAAQAKGHSSPSGPEQPDFARCKSKGAHRNGARDAGVAAPSAKKTRTSAADGLSEASARSDARVGAYSSNENDSSRGGWARNRHVTPSAKILNIVMRVVRLLRRLPRDARLDFIGRNLSEAQRQAIENFMLSEAQKAAASGSVKRDRIKEESGTRASSDSSDESLCSEDDRSDDEEEQLLALCNEANGSAKATARHARPMRFSGLTKVERARTLDEEEEDEEEEEEQRENEKQKEHEEESDLERNEEVSESGEAMWRKIAEGGMGDEDEQDEGEKMETEGEEDDDKIDEREEANCEGEASASSRGQRRASAARLRGITHETVGECHYYAARIAFAWMCISARRRRSLERALDDHILLVAIKARMTKRSPDAHGELTTPQRIFEDELRSVIPEVLQENAVSTDQFGFRIYLCVPAKYWVGRSLVSPTYTMNSLDTALRFWRSFREARGGLLFRCSPGEARQIWGRVREVYLAAWSQRGAKVCLLREKLDALEAANTRSWRRKVERWERACMQREERLQRAMVRALILAASRARREERRERVAMRNQDQLRQQRRNLPVVDQIGRLLSLWVREWEKIQRRKARRKARLHARESAAARQRSVAARHSAEKARLRALHVQREQRWRWLHRKDLTMEEILRGLPSEK